MNVFDPSKAYNAFAQGAQMGGAIRQTQTNAKLAPMVAQGDYQGAAQYAGQRGDLQSAEVYRTQYMDALGAASEEDRLKDKQRRQGIASIAMGGRNVPEDYLSLYVQENAGKLKEYGIPDEQIAQWSSGQDPLTHQRLDGFVREAMEFDQQVEAYLAQTAPQKPASPMSPEGKLRFDFREGLISEEEHQMGAARMGRPANSVTVNNSMGGAAPNQYQGLPDGTFIEPPPGTSSLKDGQVWMLRNGQPTIENAPGGAAADAADEKERKDAGRRASIARASQTVMREAGRGLELMPSIVGWSSKDKQPGVEVGGGEIATANARIMLSKIPGTAEWQWVQNMESAKSNIGLDRLQEMRDNSPTGGALGQVPFQQQQRLEQVLGAMEIGMPELAMEENTKYLQNAYMDITFGSEEERASLVQRGLMTAEENAEIQGHYHDLDWNKFGRRNAPLKYNPATDEFE